MTEHVATKRLTLPPGEDITVYFDIRIRDGQQTVATGDRMHVQHVTGNLEDVFVLAGSNSVKRVVQHMDFGTGRASISLADLPETDEKRLLAIHKMVSEKGMP